MEKGVDFWDVPDNHVWKTGDEVLYYYEDLPEYHLKKAIITDPMYNSRCSIKLKFPSMDKSGQFARTSLRLLTNPNKEESMDKNKQFWMVYSDSAQTSTKKWYSQKEAEDEAVRIATSLDIEVFVVKAMKSVVLLKAPVRWTELGSPETETKVAEKKFKYKSSVINEYNDKDVVILSESDNQYFIEFPYNRSKHWVYKKSIVPA